MLQAISWYILLICLGCSLQLNAQQNTTAGGGMAVGAGGTISYSIGQIDYVSASGSGGSAHQGVQQVFRVSVPLKYFIQGYYTSTGTMTPVLYNQGILPVPGFSCDTVEVSLHQPVAPYAQVASGKGILSTQGLVDIEFPSHVSGGSYYIALKHRNALDTWSAAPVTLNGNRYDFSTSASMAFGNNQIEVSPGIWAIYSGDLNQDENIDLLDLVLLDTDINTFGFGYLASDINGDGNVDLLDNPLVEINVNQFVFAMKP